MNLYDFVHRLWRRKFLMGSATLVGVMVAFALGQIVRPVYRAEGLLLLSAEAAQRSTLEEPGAPPPAEWIVATERDVITSPAMVAQAVLRLSLPERFSPPSRFGLPEPVGGAVARLASLLPNRIGDAGAGEDAPPIDVARDTLAVEINDESFVVLLSHSSTDPDFSADLVNALMNVYIEVKEKHISSARDAIEQRLVRRLDELDQQVADTSQLLATAIYTGRPQDEVLVLDQETKDLQSLRQRVYARLEVLLGAPQVTKSRIMSLATPPERASRVRKLLLSIAAFLTVVGPVAIFAAARGR